MKNFFLSKFHSFANVDAFFGVRILFATYGVLAFNYSDMKSGLISQIQLELTWNQVSFREFN